jgi:hypothetical protein
VVPLYPMAADQVHIHAKAGFNANSSVPSRRASMCVFAHDRPKNVCRAITMCPSCLPYAQCSFLTPFKTQIRSCIKSSIHLVGNDSCYLEGAPKKVGEIRMKLGKETHQRARRDGVLAVPLLRAVGLVHTVLFCKGRWFQAQLLHNQKRWAIRQSMSYAFGVHIVEGEEM